MKEKFKKKLHKFPQYGSIIFAIGIAIAVIVSFISLSATASKAVLATLIILGLIIGILNVTNQEAVPFLIACIAIIMLLGPFFGTLSQNFQFFQTKYLTVIFGNLISLIVPAALVVAAKTFVNTAKNEE